jgi:DNA-binding CsgD family transcriptional regulator
MEQSNINRPQLPFTDAPDYSLFKPKLQVIKNMLCVCNENIIILDYYKGGYAFVSAKEYLYCGYTEKEVTKLGSNFIQKITTEDERLFIERVQELFIKYIHSLPQERRGKVTLFMNHLIKDKQGSEFSVDIRLTPFLLNKDGYIWMMLGTASISAKTQQKEAYIEASDTLEKLNYSSPKKCFIPAKTETLTDKEKLILLLNSRGYTEQDTANNLHISVNTVKSHKRNIYKKTHTTNFSEAFVYASMHRML